jgi:hypothetical protein
MPISAIRNQNDGSLWFDALEFAILNNFLNDVFQNNYYIDIRNDLEYAMEAHIISRLKIIGCHVSTNMLKFDYICLVDTNAPLRLTLFYKSNQIDGKLLDISSTEIKYFNINDSNNTSNDLADIALIHDHIC